MTTMITVEHLQKAYGRKVALDDVSFSVEQGEIFGILGPNGAGKTTTVECLQGLRSIDSGTIRVLDLDPTTQAADLRQRIGSQLQDSALPGRLRVAETLELFAAFARHPIDHDELLARWQLLDLRNQALDSLSGGATPAALHRTRLREFPRAGLPRRAHPGTGSPGPTSDLGPDPEDP